VPLCRPHHQQLHHHGNEKAWWADLQISPLPVAKELWAASPIHQTNTAPEGAASRTSAGMEAAVP
jgi:hypothetical protein